MTNREKEIKLTINRRKAEKIVSQIINTTKELDDARLLAKVFRDSVDRLEKRLKRQNAELRRVNRIAEAITNDIDEYEEFYLLAYQMTA